MDGPHLCLDICVLAGSAAPSVGPLLSVWSFGHVPVRVHRRPCGRGIISLTSSSVDRKELSTWLTFQSKTVHGHVQASVQACPLFLCCVHHGGWARESSRSLRDLVACPFGARDGVPSASTATLTCPDPPDTSWGQPSAGLHYAPSPPPSSPPPLPTHTHHHHHSVAILAQVIHVEGGLSSAATADHLQVHSC